MVIPNLNPPYLLDDFLSPLIHVRQFESRVDLKYINQWLSKRGMEVCEKKDLPKIGFTASYDGHLIAAGFVRQCEGRVGWFDSLVCDPSCEFKIRNQCIDAVVKKVLEVCRKKKLKKILAFSINKRTLVRSEKYGFVKQPHCIISLQL